MFADDLINNGENQIEAEEVLTEDEPCEESSDPGEED
jgi:hypothetical protein